MAIHRIADGRIMEDWVLVARWRCFSNWAWFHPTTDIAMQQPL